MIRYRTIAIDGLKLFYREAGSPERPTLLLLHGFPSSSHMFRNLIPLLAERFHIVAPDLPGFGFSDARTAGSSTTPSTTWRRSSRGSPTRSASAATPSTFSTTARRSASGSRWRGRSGSRRSSRRTATPTRRA
jgi:pimeloyl-ACP methyl ester carboxylesterase